MMNRYDSYKDSGVEWIGEIPSHWDNVSTKSVSKIVNGSTPKNNTEYWEGEVVWITPSDIGPIKEQVFISDSKRKITIEGLNSCGCSMCPKNSLILTNRGPIGNVVISTVEFTTNQGCKVMIPKENMNVKYLYYFFKISNEELNMLGQGTTFLELSTNSLSMFKVNLPPLSEQQQIVSFLDTKTSLIDSLIEKTQRKIELLQEKRTSLINEVVTKGLNPNVEMKESDVEWIGEIPSHWTTPKLSFYCEVKDGTHSTPTYVDEGYPLVTQKDITKGKLDFSKTKNISKEDYDEINKRSNVVYGDIIMSMIGSIGNPTIVDTEIPFSIKNVCLFKTSESNELTNYIHYFLNSSVLMTELELKSRGGVQGFVSLDVLRNITFIKPPLSEQQQIVDYLDEHTQRIDKTIFIEEKRIELLKEYRQSLISEVVTGKRKVTTDG